MGCVLPRPGFLERLREHCTSAGTVLIFDEVMTGFRVALGGAQERFGITPDLTTLGKIVGGGMPIGIYGGRRDIMEQVAPSGPVYQAGTLSGNPVAVAAGMTTLRLLRDGGADLYARLEATTRRLAEGLHAAAAAAGVATVGHQAGAMFGLYLSRDEVWSYADAKRSDAQAFGRFFHEMLDRGVYLAPSAFEACFVSTVHDDEAVEQTIEAARGAFAAL
jgi:glutamate-1-semialdehyde 2,1-aminomutase